MNRADRNESDSAQKEPAADLENTANVPASQSLSIANSKKRPASTSMVGPDYMMSNPYGNPYGNVYSTNMGSYSGNPYSSPEQGTSYSTEAAPKHKKSRTNTPWTPAEEQKLQQLREAGGTWSEIGKVCGYLGCTT